MMKVNAITVLLFATGILLSGCGGGDGDNTDYADSSGSSSSNSNSSSSDDSNGTVTTNSSPALVTPSGTLVPNSARALAAQCFQCHGTDGRSRSGIESLLGESESELISEMLEMKRSTRNDLMHYQAKGYTEAQIRAIAAYMAALGAAGGNSDD